MQYCIDFALCNRSLMMQRIQEMLTDALPGIAFEPMINVEHNYATCENHNGQNTWLEAKGFVHAIRSQDDMQEATGAYKDIEEVIANQTDLIKLKTKLLPIAVIKG